MNTTHELSRVYEMLENAPCGMVLEDLSCRREVESAIRSGFLVLHEGRVYTLPNYRHMRLERARAGVPLPMVTLRRASGRSLSSRNMAFRSWLRLRLSRLWLGRSSRNVFRERAA